jgi:glycosyltransferase involved in cell wall biosynthesis
MMPIRVLHCIHSLQSGGAERQLILLANASASRNMAAAVACVDDSGREQLAGDVPVYSIRRRWKIDRLLLADVLTAIDSFSPDIVHAWLPAVVTVPAMMAAKLRHIPVLFSYRMAMKHDALSKPLELLVAAICADGIISNANPTWCTGTYRWLYRRKRGVLIANGVAPNPNRYSCAARRAHGEPFNLLFAGRLSAQKNWRCLLDAMALLPSESNVRLTVCGQGEDGDKVERRIVELALENRVTMAGFNPDLRDEMSDYDALVMPSLWEGMPNSVLEAMAAGLPCILSDIPEHRSACGPGLVAVYFDPRSPTALAEAIRSIEVDVGRRLAMSDAGIDRSAEMSVDRMAGRYAEAYQSFLKDACSARIAGSGAQRIDGL